MLTDNDELAPTLLDIVAEKFQAGSGSLIPTIEVSKRIGNDALDTNLADVMHVTTPLQYRNLIIRNAKPTPERCRILCKALAMALDIRIARFHR